MFHWATENGVIHDVPNLKAVKKLPRPKTSKPIFTPEEIRKLVHHASTKMKAMIWLGLNCGFGCTDCSELLWENIDLDAGRINFPRPKTGVARYLPLWKETTEALRALPRINKRVFNTKQGHKVVRFVERKDASGVARLVKCDNVSREFAELTKRTGIRKEKGSGFYTLRRTAATLAARSGDPFAVQRLLGHADLKMATTYVQDVSEQTDRVINNSRNFIVQDDS
jgi:integrase